ncbi:hypothetical protein A0J61_09551 [Choanephora cucurbitarum]|uniref:Uncharacterized protein n=1 Tax=Choanephora cucurbitarum TaxID=101091 RepID=A0A1C7N1A5_9FUNG|nr:hypothetical protein A0J61_09551 [Choanephora cucurbitarum]
MVGSESTARLSSDFGDLELDPVQQQDRQRRSLALRLAHSEEYGPIWLDQDIVVLLEELEVEVGEGMNRFMYEDERLPYAMYLSRSLPFIEPKSAEQIIQKILWLWSTWEAISLATGKSWWKISESEKLRLSLMTGDQDQQLKSAFKYFDRCDRVFAYIREEDVQCKQKESLDSEEEGEFLARIERDSIYY